MFSIFVLGKLDQRDLSDIPDAWLPLSSCLLPTIKGNGGKKPPNSLFWDSLSVLTITGGSSYTISKIFPQE